MRRAPNGEPFSLRSPLRPPMAARSALAEVRFGPTDLTAGARIQLPPEIAARAARVRIVGGQSAGAVHLLPAGSAGRNPFVGLIDPGGAGQPLVSELYYADRALQPYASLQRGGVGELIDARAQALILPDASRVSPLDRSASRAGSMRAACSSASPGRALRTTPTICFPCASRWDSHGTVCYGGYHRTDSSSVMMVQER